MPETKPKKPSKPEYTSINQVTPEHRHIEGQPLGLDQINQIDQAANNSSENFPTAFWKARNDFYKSHTFTNGVWSKN